MPAKQGEMMVKKLLPVISIFILNACASNPDNMDSAYVSTLKYRNHDCDQIAIEIDYIGSRINEVYRSLEKKHHTDQWQMGVGVILFFPLLFTLEGGDGTEAVEYTRLKGEFEALRKAAIEKKCSNSFQSLEEIIKSKQQMPSDQEDSLNN